MLTYYILYINILYILYLDVCVSDVRQPGKSPTSFEFFGVKSLEAIATIKNLVRKLTQWYRLKNHKQHIVNITIPNQSNIDNNKRPIKQTTKQTITPSEPNARL